MILTINKNQLMQILNTQNFLNQKTLLIFLNNFFALSRSLLKFSPIYSSGLILNLLHHSFMAKALEFVKFTLVLELIPVTTKACFHRSIRILIIVSTTAS